MKYLTKAELYKSVDKLIEELDITSCDYPLNSILLAKKFFINAEILYEDFDSFCALLYRGKRTTTLTLNSRRSSAMQNFDCMHEIIHYFLHEDLNTFECLGSDNNPSLNDSLEWQANEGAAEALLPYRMFIPMYISLCEENEETAITYLANKFCVTERVIENRIDNLQCEIYQYKVLNKNIDNIEILSKTGLERKKLDKLTAVSEYCTRCHNILLPDANYCSVCGEKLTTATVETGAGSISYNDIETLPDFRTARCPLCGNRDFPRSAFYCHLCGAPVVNRCINQSGHDAHGMSLEWSCDGLLKSNARFCPTCGHETVFAKSGILKKIEIK